MIPRARCEAAFAAAVAACDPAARVHRALARKPLHGRDVFAIAIGKAALAMARGAGRVARGIAVAPVLDGAPLPLGWSALDAGHPDPDDRSVAAARAALDVIEEAGPHDAVLALISGGASALVELPAEGVTLEALRARIAALRASGAPIRAINAERTRLSTIKGGRLAARSAAPVVTLIASDVIGDDPRVIGSGPTVRPGDRVEVIATMASFGEALARALGVRRIADPVDQDVLSVTRRLAREAPPVVAWGEPTVTLPRKPGVGGRAQQLALALALELHASDRSAFVAGSDGSDGPAPPGRPTPAGAYVDGTTCDRLAAAGLDAADALARCDAGTALAAVGALVVTGATGINHADVMIVG